MLAGMAVASPSCLYVYALVCGEVSGSLPSGICGHAVECFVSSGVTVVHSRVSRSLFEGDDAAARLGDLAWLGPEAASHQAVLDGCQGFGPVLPMRFATLFSSEERVVSFLARNRDPIAAFVARTSGCSEWAVKAVVEWEALRSAAEERALAAADLPEPGGRRYFLERKLRKEAAEAAEVSVRARVATCLDSVRGIACAMRSRDLPAPSPAPAGQVICNEAVLLRSGEQVQLERILVTEEGLSWSVSGPWPPYSFAPALT